MLVATKIAAARSGTRSALDGSTVSNVSGMLHVSGGGPTCSPSHRCRRTRRRRARMPLTGRLHCGAFRSARLRESLRTPRDARTHRSRHLSRRRPRSGHGGWRPPALGGGRPHGAARVHPPPARPLAGLLGGAWPRPCRGGDAAAPAEQDAAASRARDPRRRSARQGDDRGRAQRQPARPRRRAARRRAGLRQRQARRRQGGGPRHPAGAARVRERRPLPQPGAARLGRDRRRPRALPAAERADRRRPCSSAC